MSNPSLKSIIITVSEKFSAAKLFARHEKVDLVIANKSFILALHFYRSAPTSARINLHNIFLLFLIIELKLNTWKKKPAISWLCM